MDKFQQRQNLERQINNLKEPSRLKQLWQMIRDKPTVIIHLVNIVLLIICLFTYPQIDHSYQMANFERYLVFVTCLGIVLGVLLDVDWKKPMEKTTKTNWCTSKSRFGRSCIVAWSVAVVLFAGSILTSNVPVARSKTPRSDRIYVTYSPTCKYCRVAHQNLLKAASVYNQTHIKKQVELVNLDHPTSLTDDLLDVMTVKGSVVKITDDSRSAIPYTQKTINMEPVVPTPDHIYEQIVKIANN